MSAYQRHFTCYSHRAHPNYNKCQLTKEINFGLRSPKIVLCNAVIISVVVGLDKLDLESVPLLHGLEVLVVPGLFVDVKLIVISDPQTAL